MAISFNTGATAHAETAASVNLAIPAGVLAGDVMALILTVFCETGVQPVIAFAGGGGAWTPVPVNTGANPEVATAGSVIWSYGFAYTRVATAGDPGATVTISETGSAAGTTWLAVAMAAYTGASPAAPVDVAFGGNAQGANVAGTFPSGNTAADGDWSLFMAAYGLPAGSTPALAGEAKRADVFSAADVGATIWDSAAAVGPAGTAIGGGTITGIAGGTDWWSLFTVGLTAFVAPPSTGLDYDDDAPWHIRRRMAG